MNSALRNDLNEHPAKQPTSMKITQMKNLTGLLLLALASASASGQAPVIASFGRNGELVCTNLLPGTTASVEWASSVLGPWTNTWAGLEAVTADPNGVIRVSVPMFYRVAGYPRVPTNMCWIPAGTFVMGSPPTEPCRDSDEGPQTQVTISRGFCLGKYEVTQGEYLAVMGSNPSYFQGDLNRPVETVSWNDAVAYCAALTAREQAAGRLPAGWEYRLPTEAQWEYACRAGTTTVFHYGNELRSGMANFNGRYEYPGCAGSSCSCYNAGGIYLGRTTAVGSYVPNAWGLDAMHGNVWEWCADWWVGSLPGGSVTDPQGPATGSYRVIRGGSWSHDSRYCRSARRYASYPADRSGSFGFRVVLASGQP
jgi:formylglycine-generating enzyme required for sulfatase activity